MLGWLFLRVIIHGPLEDSKEVLTTDYTRWYNRLHENILFFLIYIRLLVLSERYIALIIKAVAIHLLLFNKFLFLAATINLIFIFSRLVYHLTDYTETQFRKGLYQSMQIIIQEDEAIKATKENAIKITYWVTRSLNKTKYWNMKERIEQQQDLGFFNLSCNGQINDKYYERFYTDKEFEAYYITGTKEIPFETEIELKKKNEKIKKFLMIMIIIALVVIIINNFPVSGDEISESFVRFLFIRTPRVTYCRYKMEEKYNKNIFLDGLSKHIVVRESCPNETMDSLRAFTSKKRMQRVAIYEQAIDDKQNITGIDLLLEKAKGTFTYDSLASSIEKKYSTILEKEELGRIPLEDKKITELLNAYEKKKNDLYDFFLNLYTIKSKEGLPIEVLYRIYSPIFFSDLQYKERLVLFQQGLDWAHANASEYPITEEFLTTYSKASIIFEKQGEALINYTQPSKIPGLQFSKEELAGVDLLTLKRGEFKDIARQGRETIESEQGKNKNKKDFEEQD